MSHRIFVNTQNSKYKSVAQNSKGFQFGLGVPTDLTDDERISLQQQAYEIYFSADDLREKKRKIQIIFDSLTDPKFFGDGAVKIDKVEKYYNELQLEAQRTQQLTNTAGDVVLYGTALYFTGLIGAFALQGVLSTLQAKREDDAAPWKMTRADFPNINAQAIQNSPTRRSIERLYDDRSGRIRNISTEEAIALLVRETLADALFCTSNPGGTATTLPEHPGPGGNGDRNKWISKDALKRHFPFKQETTGADRLERTYVNALIYLKSYIDLIDNILNLQQQTLSRSPDVEESLINIPIRISLSTANVQLFNALTNTVRQVVREKVLTFFDENREYKTLLNFGEDRQYVAEAWRLAPQSTGSVQLKLLQPLNSDITVETPAFISREIASSVIDTIEFELSPEVDNTPYLRPYNMDDRNYVDNKMLSTNSTLNSLGLDTGSAGTVNNGYVSYGDSVFRRWFTGDFKASELNIDFTNYNKFVHFGSAYKRLDAFRQKLEKIEELTSASIYAGSSTSTVSALLKAKEKEDIIRKFDPYEQFLYYATGSIAYSASAFYATDTNEIEYNATGSWPKQTDGTVYSPYSSVATNWLNTQLSIAQRYDDNNPNYLILNLPKHIQEDGESTEFLTLFDMVGHLMDNIKVYIDQFPNIYSTKINPLEELTMDQVYEVAQSFGIKLPNVYALESLQTFNAQFAGESGSRSYVAETWKRFLHSMVYFGKTKGSRTSFDALLNNYGIQSPVLQIKETTYPAVNNYIRSDELTYGLKFTSSISNNIRIPFVSSSISASTLQISFNPILRQSSSLVTANNWAIDVVPHPSQSKEKYGRLEVYTTPSRTLISTSSYFRLFSDDYTHIMLRSQSSDLTIIQTDGDQILFKQSASVDLSSVWSGTTFIYVGGFGSMKLPTNFDGVVDEIRVWGESISDEDFVHQAYDPGSYYGANYTSSYANLYVHVPFSQPLVSVTSSVTNESPYQNVSIVQTLPAVGFTTASYSRILRSIKQFTPVVGSTVYTNNKISVAPAPVFNEQFIDENGTKILSKNTSIKKVEEKQYNSGQNVVYFAVSPTDFINQNIMRSMGIIDVNNIIGSPRYTKGTTYPTLQEIQKDYIEYFNKKIQPNEYIRFFKDLTQGPGELAEQMVPARAKLLDGIVIESPIISRNKDNITRTIAVDGIETKKFNNYVLGSGSIGIGAYNFDQMIEEVSLVPSTLGDTLPITATIAVSGSVNIKSSTKSDKMPPFRRVIQKINSTDISNGSYSYVTASVLDENSAYVTLEAKEIDTRVSYDTVSIIPARALYYGIPQSGSVLERIPSEENTVEPIYNIPPRADLNDVGVTTYFHKPTGIYSYTLLTPYNQNFLVKLDTKVDNPLSRLYSKITLLDINSIVNVPGRDEATIEISEYKVNEYYLKPLFVPNIFSIFGLMSEAGLRIRIYNTETDAAADRLRPFSTPPEPSANVLFDTITNNVSQVFPYTLVQTQNNRIYCSIENTTGSSIISHISIEYFGYEPANNIPLGYLPRHYRFSRDNTTALKRRNYLGCRDVNTTFDGESPVVISISNTNTVVVNSNAVTSTVNIPADSRGVRFGGAGRLGVEGN